MRMRKKKNLVPRMEACDACWIRRPEEHRGRWRELMPGARELRVELGCGKGRFTAAELNVQLRAVGHELAPMAAHGLRFVYHKLRALFHAWGKIRSFSHSHVLSHSCPKV